MWTVVCRCLGWETILLLKDCSFNFLRLRPKSSFCESCSVSTTISTFFSFDETRCCKKCIWMWRTARTLQMMGPSYPVLNVCELKLKKEKYKNRRQIVTGTVLSSHQPAMPSPLCCWNVGGSTFFIFLCIFFLLSKATAMLMSYLSL
jgi:hypothetical protein